MKYKPLNLNSREADLLAKLLLAQLKDENYHINNSLVAQYGAETVNNIVSRLSKLFEEEK